MYRHAISGISLSSSVSNLYSSWPHPCTVQFPKTEVLPSTFRQEYEFKIFENNVVAIYSLYRVILSG